jgi:hypothetical protein
LQTQRQSQNMKENRGEKSRKKIFQMGKRETSVFPNGVRKQIFPDGYTIVFFNNHDIKQTYPNDKSVYYFAENDTTQTTYSSGIKVFRFGNGQNRKSTIQIAPRKIQFHRWHSQVHLRRW